jgi:hypothetical protein
VSLFQRGNVWWYEFWFAGQRIREPSKSTSKTVAKDAERNRKRELEEGFNNIVDQRQQRVRTFRDIADEFFDGYKLRLPDSVVFADYAIDQLSSSIRMTASTKALHPRQSMKRSVFCCASWESQETSFVCVFARRKC